MQAIDPSEPRPYSYPIGPIGRAVALWAIICAVSVTSAGGVIGYMVGFGVVMMSAPLRSLGAPVSAMPVILADGLILVAVFGALQLAFGLRWEKMQPAASRGVHLIGASTAIWLCLNAAQQVV